MAKRYTPREALDFIFDHDSDQEERSQVESEEALEEEVSEVEEDTEYNPEEEDPAEVVVSFWSKNGNFSWMSSPPERRGQLPSETVIRMTPGPTRYVISRVDDIKSCFQLFLTDSMVTIVMNMTNLEGRRVYGDTWKEVDPVNIEAYVGVLILCGVYRSRNESASSLWDADTGRAIFPATMSLQTFHILSHVIRFDDRHTRAACRQHDKLAPIREVWQKWVERLPLIYKPGPDITVDERLVGFRGRCPFKKYMPNKPPKYGIKIWACDAKTSYATVFSLVSKK
ncbi:piggyBac transposable element-derived protein 4-like [Enoplosus armatus]|uniref:piggyBac transposable element-derived protein 4-like n=1 Tax=Enoplosus armatus TaxID=215367 RepID=UPI0039942BDF